MMKKLSMSMFVSTKDYRKAVSKQFIDANVWDGEDRSGADGDGAGFTPDELQELIDDLIDHLYEI